MLSRAAVLLMLAALAAAAATARAAWDREGDAWLAQVHATSAPVWFTAAGPRPAVADALRVLRTAADHGLVVDDDAIATLGHAVRDAASPEPDAQAVRRADVALSRAVLRLMSDLRFGRVPAREVAPHYRVAERDAAFVAALRDAVAADRLQALVAGVAPRHGQYRRLTSLLARYRELAAGARGWPPLERSGAKVVAGEPYAAADALRARLTLLGDLAADAPAPEGRYTRVLADAVTRFQARHGLVPDGVLGRNTFAALDVPPSARIEQIVLSLERMRWLPDVEPGPLVAINIPSYRLWAFADAAGDDPPRLAMPVIVGRAARTQTPVFVGTMQRVEFSPYWNVPRSILKGEYLGALARDPALLAREDMEAVPARGRGPAITSVDASVLAGLRDGTLRLRQRPGPGNALGGVKFVLPNAMQIFLHGTPAQALFERTRRDFSHGCIRVRDPAALARFVLAGRPEWTGAAIEAAMASGTPRTVPLPAPIPVVVFYTTAVVDDAGQARFLPDVYGHDRRLARALAARSAPPR